MWSSTVKAVTPSKLHKEQDLMQPYEGWEEWSPTGKARGSQETPIRGEHPVPEDQFIHG